MAARRYNHLYGLGFSVVSSTEDGSDITEPMLKEALIGRLRGLGPKGLLEACGSMGDTYPVSEIPETNDN